MGTIEKALEKGLYSGELLRDPANRAESDHLQAGDSLPPAQAAGRVGLAPSSRKTRKTIRLDVESLKSNGMIVPDEKRSRVKEEYRNIKRPLLMNAAGKGATVVSNSNLLMVTSSRPSEGKTYTALNLALSIALERDKTVLLIDADILRSTLSRFLGIREEPGLVDYLDCRSSDLSELLIRTDLPNLSVLPAGNAHHLSTELLASSAMRQLAVEMSKRYHDRIIILDSPPLLSTSESRVLADLVGQVVMVVAAGETRQSDVTEALSLIPEHPLVGCVLNKVKHSFGGGYGYYYRYGYGYGYGYGASHGRS